MNFRRHGAIAAAMLLWCSPSVAAGSKRVVEKDDDGRVRARYWVDDGGRRDGEYTAFHPGGRKRLRTQYEEGVEHGWRETWDTRGKALSRVLVFRGRIAHPRSTEELDAVLTELLPDRSPRDLESMRTRTLRWVQAYRHLCGVPYRDLVLDEELNERCQAAVRLFEELGHQSHRPDNPGWTEEEHALATDGALHSNLSTRTSGVTARSMVQGQIWDSSPRNIGRLGHRHWLLNPAMLQLGVGIEGDFGTIWAHDESRDEDWPVEWTAFPPPGFTPVDLVDYEYARSQPYAWSIFLDGKVFAVPPAKDLVVDVRPIDRDLELGEPLSLDNVAVHHMSVRQLQQVVIFRPLGVRIRDGSRYRVLVSGMLDLRDPQRPPRELLYVVEFFDRSSND